MCKVSSKIKSKGICIDLWEKVLFERLRNLKTNLTILFSETYNWICMCLLNVLIHRTSIGKYSFTERTWKLLPKM